ncbi:Hachiman antiphage defense system protein HamA [Paenalcaligenes hominis]|uniref:Hachiman antiphage defense system protein HamA n=1 Tax=Paenalcaligenes hominis TaxID=643674 RepID=UPI00352315B9
MTRFSEWCDCKELSLSKHKLEILTAEPLKRAHAVEVVAGSVPEHYASHSRILDLLERLGRESTARYLAEKLPTSLSIKSGDLGEILCSSFVAETTGFTLGIKRLRWKDHRNMSMRGEDFLGFSLGENGKSLKVLKAEVKSRASLQTSVVNEARDALSNFRELPSAHAISFVADRLGETGNKSLQDALDDVQLKKGFRKSQVTHMLFTFSGTNPSNMLSRNLKAYAGTVRQHYVGIQVSGHRDFINDVFEAVEV